MFLLLSQPSSLSRNIRFKLLGVTGVVAVLILWQLMTLFVSPIALPKPSEAFGSLVDNVGFWREVSYTLLRVAVAAAIVLAASALSLVLLYYHWSVEAVTSWFLGFLRSIPPIVLLPAVFIIVTEREFGARIVLAAVGSYPVFMANVIAGLRAIPPSRIETIRLFSGNSKWAIFRHVVLKEMIPHFIVGLRITFAFCMIIVVVSEMVWGTSLTPSIGTYVRDAMSNSDTPVAWAIILLLGGVGVAFNFLLDGLEKWLVTWREGRG